MIAPPRLRPRLRPLARALGGPDAGAGEPYAAGRRRDALRLAAGAAGVVAVALLAAGAGAVRIPLDATAGIALDLLPGISVDGDWPQSWRTIVAELRLPRVVVAGLVGAMLAVSGAAYQGLFRNPLADPYLVGGGVRGRPRGRRGVPDRRLGVRRGLGPAAPCCVRRGDLRRLRRLPGRQEVRGAVDDHADPRRSCGLCADRGGDQPADDPQRPRSAPAALVAAGRVRWRQVGPRLAAHRVRGARDGRADGLLARAERHPAGRRARARRRRERRARQDRRPRRRLAAYRRGRRLQRRDRLRRARGPARGAQDMGPRPPVPPGDVGAGRRRLPDPRRPRGEDAGRPRRASGGHSHRVRRGAVLHLPAGARGGAVR